MHHDDHSFRNQRLIDIMCVVALFGFLWGGYFFLTHSRDVPLKTSFIVPSQSVHW